RWYLAQDQTAREKAADERTLTAAGVEHTEDMARYLWDSHVSAVVSDSPSVEVWPPDWSRESRPFGVLPRLLVGAVRRGPGGRGWAGAGPAGGPAATGCSPPAGR